MEKPWGHKGRVFVPAGEIWPTQMATRILSTILLIVAIGSACYGAHQMLSASLRSSYDYAIRNAEAPRRLPEVEPVADADGNEEHYRLVYSSSRPPPVTSDQPITLAPQYSNVAPSPYKHAPCMPRIPSAVGPNDPATGSAVIGGVGNGDGC
jgi:hypothetical protein